MLGETAGTDLATAPSFRLGAVEIFPRACEAVVGPRRERLQKRVMQVLVALASSPNSVVSRDELIDACWRGLSVTDDAITRCILRLRRLARDVGGFQIDTIMGVGYRLTVETAPLRDALPRLPDKPSVAVMPFVSLSDDPEQDYLAEGMVEEIVGALARFKSIHVVPAGGGMLLDGEMLNPQEAARRLGVRYVLDGSVRKVPGCVRVVVHLKDAENGALVWTDRLEETAGDFFGLQDRVAARVAGAIETTLQDVGVSKAVARPTTDMGSFDLYLRSLSPFRAFTREAILQSVDYLDQAVTLDPRFALALSQSGVCHRLLLEHGWADDPKACRTRGLELVKRALQVDTGDAKVLAQCAASLAGLEHDLSSAMGLIERALTINPASSFVCLISGTLHLRAGEPQIAAEYLERAMQLDPISGMNRYYRMYLALARFQQGRFDDALALLRTTELRIPVIHAVLAAMHGHMGHPGRAQAALAEFHNLGAGAPDDIARLWFRRPEHSRLLLNGIALAEAAAALPGAGRTTSQDA